jgi:hypothetical protein
VACATGPSASVLASTDAVVFAGFGASPAPQSIDITSPAGSVAWTATSDAAWLTIVPSSGATIPVTVNLTAHTNGLDGGTHFGTIHVAAGGGALDLPLFLDVPSVSGVWKGTVFDTIPLLLSLKDSSGVITGTGAFVGADGTQLPLLIGGTHVHPYAVFSLNATLFEPATVSVVFFSPDTLKGTVTRSLLDQPLTLVRQ